MICSAVSSASAGFRIGTPAEPRHDPLTLGDVEHVVVAKKWDLLDLTGFLILLFQELSEDDELALLALADMTALLCALPEGDLLIGLHTKEQMVQQTVGPDSYVRDSQTGTAILPRLVPRNGACFQCFDDAVGDYAVDVDAHVVSPLFLATQKRQ